MFYCSVAYAFLGVIHISDDAPPPGREGLTKSVIIVSSEGGRGLTKVSPDIEREMGWGKKKKKKKIDDDEEELELEKEK